MLDHVYIVQPHGKVDLTYTYIIRSLGKRQCSINFDKSKNSMEIRLKVPLHHDN